MAEFIRNLGINTIEKKIIADTALGLVAYCGYRLFSGSKPEEQAATTEPTQHDSKVANEPRLGDAEFPGVHAVVRPDQMPDLSAKTSLMADQLKQYPEWWG